MKKARLNGFRKKRTNQILFGAHVEQIETITAEHELTEHALDDVAHTEFLLQALGHIETELQTEEQTEEQTESVLEALVQNETIQKAVVQTESVPDLDLQAVAQSEPDCAVEEVKQVKQALGRAVGRPTSYDKKKKSINLLCAVKVEKDKKASGKKDKKSSAKKSHKK